jgi:hypothetical protein
VRERGCPGAARARTLWRVSAFSASPSLVADTVPILILNSLAVNLSLKAKESPSSTSLDMGVWGVGWGGVGWGGVG